MLEDELMRFKDISYHGYVLPEDKIIDLFYYKFLDIPLMSRMEAVADYFIDEIETVILERTQFKYEADENKECVVTGIKNKIREDILGELNGWYFEMMYGKKKQSKVTEEENG